MNIVDRVRQWWEDHAWRPTPEVEDMREQRAAVLHEEAIAARIDLEQSSAQVARRLGRIERLAAAYAREDRTRLHRPGPAR